MCSLSTNFPETRKVHSQLLLFLLKTTSGNELFVTSHRVLMHGILFRPLKVPLGHLVDLHIQTKRVAQQNKASVQARS